MNAEINHELKQARNAAFRKIAALEATFAALKDAANNGDGALIEQADAFLAGYVGRDVAALTADLTRIKVLNEVAAIINE